MLIIEKAITGSESGEIKASEPMAALIEFYRAFNSGDLELMSKNWEQSDEASMSNPLGGVKRSSDLLTSGDFVTIPVYRPTADLYPEIS